MIIPNQELHAQAMKDFPQDEIDKILELIEIAKTNNYTSFIFDGITMTATKTDIPMADMFNSDQYLCGGVRVAGEFEQVTNVPPIISDQYIDDIYNGTSRDFQSDLIPWLSERANRANTELNLIQNKGFRFTLKSTGEEILQLESEDLTRGRAFMNVGRDRGSFDAEAGGDHFVHGTHGQDRIAGGDGDDWLDGNGGEDTIIGGQGNDYILVDSSVLSIDGGEGEDTLVLSECEKMQWICILRMPGAEWGPIDQENWDLSHMEVLQGIETISLTHSYMDGFNDPDIRLTLTAEQIIKNHEPLKFLGGAFDTLVITGRELTLLGKDSEGFSTWSVSWNDADAVIRVDSDIQVTNDPHLAPPHRGVKLPLKETQDEIMKLDSEDGDRFVNGTQDQEQIDGGDGNDRLDGKGGEDAIFGGKGDDLILVDSAVRSVDGGEGDDTLLLSDCDKMSMTRCPLSSERQVIVREVWDLSKMEALQGIENIVLSQSLGSFDDSALKLMLSAEQIIKNNESLRIIGDSGDALVIEGGQLQWLWLDSAGFSQWNLSWNGRERIILVDSDIQVEGVQQPSPGTTAPIVPPDVQTPPVATETPASTLDSQLRNWFIEKPGRAEEDLKIKHSKGSSFISKNAGEEDKDVTSEDLMQGRVEWHSSSDSSRFSILCGDDRYVLGNRGADKILGGKGDDWLDGRGGKDIIIGGKGDDTILADFSVLRVDGGEGKDTLLLTDCDQSLPRIQLMSEASTQQRVCDLSKTILRGIENILLTDAQGLNSSAIKLTFTAEQIIKNKETLKIDGNGHYGLVIEGGDLKLLGDDVDGYSRWLLSWNGKESLLLVDSDIHVEERLPQNSEAQRQAWLAEKTNGIDTELKIHRSGGRFISASTGTEVKHVTSEDLIHGKVYWATNTVYGHFSMRCGEDRYVMGKYGAEKIYGGKGDDWLDGRGGKDIIIAGKGDDHILVDSSVRSIQGGEGNDTLLLSPARVTRLDLSPMKLPNGLDLSHMKLLKGIENIDLDSGKIVATLHLTAKQILRNSESLTIFGDRDDTLVIEGEHFQVQGADSDGFSSWQVSWKGHEALIRVDSDIQVV
ncbi:MAG: hypothetical protein RL095_3691 [Verrucomicrobiota bacterium]|jgi:Ca2+-binding RTX toxin-like protein